MIFSDLEFQTRWLAGRRSAHCQPGQSIDRHSKCSYYVLLGVQGEIVVEQRISMTSLVVDDIAEARRFFEVGLGWQVNAAPSPEVVFFQVVGGVFALYSRAALAKEIGQDVTGNRTGAVTLAWNSRSEDDVDKMFKEALQAGARTVKQPEKSFWGGYSSYVEIPGGHLLEIAYNPFWSIEPDGAVTLPPPL